MAEIPIDLIVEILLRLPVVDVLRFRCVSKQWRSLIDSPSFVQSHLNLPNKPQSFLVIDRNRCIYYFDLDSVYDANSPPNLKELGEPCHEIYSNCDRFVGHVNGLVCCVCNPGGVILWNPSTRKHIEVPPPEERSRFESEQRVVYWSWGFGFDRDSDDYKVLALAYLVDEKGDLERVLVWIYSLRFGSWRRIDDFPYFLPSYRNDCVFFDGAFHWKVDSLSDHRPSYLICSLHLGTLEYSLVPIPNCNSITYLCGLGLGVLDECLTVTCYHEGCPDVYLWVMKEYGVKESWTRLIGYEIPFRPLAYTENGKELLCFARGEIVSCELETGSYKSVIRSPISLAYSVVCIPSLVCPRSDL